MFQYRYISSECFRILLTRIAEFTACPWRAADPYVHANRTGFLISGLCEKDVLQNRESLQLHSFEVSEFFEVFFSVKVDFIGLPVRFMSVLQKKIQFWITELMSHSQKFVTHQLGFPQVWVCHALVNL